MYTGQLDSTWLPIFSARREETRDTASEHLVDSSLTRALENYHTLYVAFMGWPMIVGSSLECDLLKFRNIFFYVVHIEVLHSFPYDFSRFLLVQVICFISYDL